MEVVVVKKAPKAQIQMVHFAQFIAFTHFPLGLTSELVVEAPNSFYDALYHRYRTSSVTSSTYPQHLLQSVRHYIAMYIYLSVIPPYYCLFWGVEWVKNGGTRVVNEPYITTNNDL